MNSYCYSDGAPSFKFASEVRPMVGGGSGNVYSEEISTIKVLDKAEYDALEIKEPTTVYLIKG